MKQIILITSLMAFAVPFNEVIGACCDGVPVPAGFRCCTPSEKQAAQTAFQECQAQAQATALQGYAAALAAYNDCNDVADERKDAGMEVVDDLLDQWITACQNQFDPPEDVLLEPICIYGAMQSTAPLYTAVWATYAAQRALCALDWSAAKGLVDGQYEIDISNCQNTLMAACDND